MNIAIVGPPASGKTTIFNAVTGARSGVGAYAGGRPNVGVAKVADPRMELFETVFQPARAVAAEIGFIDLPPSYDGSGRSFSVSGEDLNHLQNADCLMLVVSVFKGRSVPHLDDGINPAHDLQSMRDELALADLLIVERRLSRVREASKGSRASEREPLEREEALLAALRESLEEGAPVRERSLSSNESRMLAGFRLLTAKPLMAVANISEDQIPGAGPLEERLAAGGVPAAALCGLLEAELAAMEPDERREYRESFGLVESGIDRLVRLARRAVGLITFFTGNDREVRAWQVTTGTTAVEAAGKIHSDMARGFIRAEVVAHGDLEECGTLAEARRRGLLRQEGREYRVTDGDLVNILFSV